MKKIIWFISGVPTLAQRQEAAEIGAVIRDPASVGRPGDFLEQCNEVKGETIPKEYQDKPRAKAGAPPAAPEIGLDSGMPDFAAMDTKELGAYAEENGVTFPKSVDTRREIAAYLKKWWEKNKA